MDKYNKVLVAMSGGVDSSLVAALLKERGFNVAGAFMDLGQANMKPDKEAAKQVAKKLGILFKVVNLKKEFKKEVIEYFIHEYSIGNTPNPCAICNKKIKLGLLLKKARELKFNYLATGHYIKLKKTKDGFHLYEGDDLKKDQSYFLYNLKQSQLKHLMFPLEKFPKDQVIKMAKERKLPTLEGQSQDICFLGGIDHNIFLKKHVKMKKGPIITTEGKTVGEHEGLPLYTIGQRRYIKIGGIGPFYAAEMDYKNNVLRVTNRFDDKILYNKELIARRVNWTSGKKPKMPLKCTARIRYQHPKENCVVTYKKGKYIVKFTKPQRAVTPGQSVVFYKNKELLGGGVITKK
jgi:tRNA-uridine 2-sulfurtransferase